MDESPHGPRYGRDIAGLVGERVMASLEDALERLRREPEGARDRGVPQAVRPDHPREGDPPSSPRALPARAAADLIGALTEAIVPAVLSRIDIDALLDRVDVERLVDRVDVEGLVRRIDLDELAGRLDVDALLAGVDVDALVRRIDLKAAMAEAMEAVDVGELVRDSTATIGSDIVEDLRSQAMRADEVLGRVVQPAAAPLRTPPHGARPSAGDRMSRVANQPSVQRRQGTRAGAVSRLLADAVDLVAVVLIALLVLLVVSALRGLFSRGFDFVSLPQPWRGILAAVLLVAYLGYGWGLEGRTLGKTVMGLRVVHVDGSDLSPARGLLRAFAYLLVPPGILWSLFSHQNASLQDLVLRTAVVHDWGFATAPPGVEREAA